MVSVLVFYSDALSSNPDKVHSTKLSKNKLWNLYCVASVLLFESHSSKHRNLNIIPVNQKYLNRQIYILEALVLHNLLWGVFDHSFAINFPFIFQPRPISLILGIFTNLILINSLGFEPVVAVWRAQTKPLSYGPLLLLLRSKF